MSSIPPKENDDEVIITDKSDADQIPALLFVTGKFWLMQEKILIGNRWGIVSSTRQDQ